MSDQFFKKPILNTPYEYPSRHWELDSSGQPTSKIVDSRRRAEFITPIPKPRKRKAGAAQLEMVYDEARELSTGDQAETPASHESSSRPTGSAFLASSQSQYLKGWAAP